MTFQWPRLSSTLKTPGLPCPLQQHIGACAHHGQQLPQRPRPAAGCQAPGCPGTRPACSPSWPANSASTACRGKRMASFCRLVTGDDFRWVLELRSKLKFCNLRRNQCREHRQPVGGGDMLPCHQACHGLSTVLRDALYQGVACHACRPARLWQRAAPPGWSWPPGSPASGGCRWGRRPEC